mgnify:CR=1 FL=1
MFAILVLVVVARAVAAPTVAANKTSSRVDADEKRLLGVMQTSSQRRGKPPQRREEEEEEEEKEGSPAERERERKTRAKAHSKHPFDARGKREREREREKKPFESAGGHAESAESRDCRFCGDVFPDKSIRRKEHHTRGARASFREII